MNFVTDEGKEIVVDRKTLIKIGRRMAIRASVLEGQLIDETVSSCNQDSTFGWVAGMNSNPIEWWERQSGASISKSIALRLLRLSP